MDYMQIVAYGVPFIGGLLYFERRLARVESQLCSILEYWKIVMAGKGGL